jgi:hypothetical protein
VLFIPARNALPSSTPRSTRIVVRADLPHQSHHALRADQLDDEVRRQIRAADDHPPHQIFERQLSPDHAVELRIGVLFRVERVRRAVEDADEFVSHSDRSVETELAARDSFEDSQHDRDLHRAGGVKDLVLVPIEARSVPQIVVSDCNRLSAVSREDAIDVAREIGWRRRRAAGEKERGCDECSHVIPSRSEESGRGLPVTALPDSSPSAGLGMTPYTPVCSSYD